MADIKSSGVTLKTLREYKDQVEAGYLAIDPQWNINPESPDGQTIAIWSELMALLDEQVVNAYLSHDPASATGQSLNHIAAFAGLSRQAATRSSVTLRVRGVEGTIVPAGSQARDVNGNVWTTESSVNIERLGSFVNATANSVGSISASIGEINKIATPVGGWQEVTNQTPAIRGRDEETDIMLRQRRTRSVALGGSNQIDNIMAAIGDVDGAGQVRIYENVEDYGDDNGLSGHSIAIFVEAGDVEQINQAILSRKNPGAGMNARSGFPLQITTETETAGGNPAEVTFFRPEPVTVYVSVDIEASGIPESLKPEIKEAVVDYAEQGFLPSAGFSKRGFRIGEDIISGRLYTPVNNIIGDRGGVVSLSISTEPEGMYGSRVNLKFNQLGVWSSENITVNYV